MTKLNKLKLIKTLMGFLGWVTLGIFFINLVMSDGYGILIFFIAIIFFVLYIIFASEYKKLPDYKKEKTSWKRKSVKTILILISILFFFHLSFLIAVESSKKYSENTEELCSFSTFLIYTEYNKKTENYELINLDKILKIFKGFAIGPLNYSFVMPEKSGKINITTRDGESILKYKVTDKTENYITYEISYSLEDYFVENAYKVFIKENKIIPVYSSCIHAMSSSIIIMLSAVFTVLFGYFFDFVIFLYFRFAQKKS